MRKLLLPGVLVVAIFVACENKSPVGPNGVGPGGLTVTQTTSTTTTSTTTTTIPSSTTTSTTTTVTGSLSRRYVAFQPPPTVPSDMTLFFQLITSATPITALIDRLPFIGAGAPAVTENEYKVTGVYVMPNGTTGTVDGELGGSLNPLETGGEFDGTMTAKVGTCTAERQFDGELGPQTLRWSGGATLSDCPGSPLSFQSFSMLRSDAPLPTTTVPPTTTSTTTSVSTTTSSSTSSTTTTAPVCSYTLSPTSATATAAGGTGQVVVGTLPSCPWTAQSFASWLSVTPPSGSGAGSVTWTAQPNVNGPERSGTAVIAGLTFTVRQEAPPPPDYVPSLAGATAYCSFNGTTNQWMATVTVTNIGTGAGAAPSTTRMTFTNPISATSPLDQTTAALAVKQQVNHSFALPSTCFNDGFCDFSIGVDAQNVLFESNENNNSVSGSCGAPIVNINRTAR